MIYWWTRLTRRFFLVYREEQVSAQRKEKRAVLMSINLLVWVLVDRRQSCGIWELPISLVSNGRRVRPRERRSGSLWWPIVCDRRGHVRQSTSRTLSRPLPTAIPSLWYHRCIRFGHRTAVSPWQSNHRWSTDCNVDLVHLWHQQAHLDSPSRDWRCSCNHLHDRVWSEKDQVGEHRHCLPSLPRSSTWTIRDRRYIRRRLTLSFGYGAGM